MSNTSDHTVVAHHRLVANTYGTDVVVRHETSGVDLHLRRQFLGDLTESFLNERLGKCNLPVDSLLTFFDITSYMPGRAIGRVMSPLIWIDFALVSDLLDLPHCGPSMWLNISNNGRILTSATLKMLLSMRAYHRPVVIDDLVLSFCYFIGQQRSSRVNYCFPLLKEAYFDKVDMIASCFFLLGAGHVELAVDRFYGAESICLNRICLGAIQVRDASFARNFLASLDVMVNKRGGRTIKCNAAYVCKEGTKYEDLPIEIGCAANGESFDLVARSPNDTIDSVFGTALAVGDAILVPFDRRNVHLVQTVVVRSRSDKKLTCAPVPLVNRATAPGVGDCHNVRAGHCKGVHVVTSVFPNTPIKGSVVFGLIPSVDPFVASANFTIKIGEDGGDWRVHDWVLYERWSYFKHVVDAGMTETCERTLVLPPDFPASLLHMILFYVYTSSFDASDEEIASVRSFLRQNAELHRLGKLDERDNVVVGSGWFGFLDRFFN